MRRPWIILGVLALLAAIAVLLRLNVGGSLADLPEAARGTAISLRTTRIIAAMASGLALATSGVFLQSLLRNPLASPDLLGMAAGASLGVISWTYIGYLRTGQLGQVGVGLSAIPAGLGALGALAIVYAFSQRRGFIEPVSLVLVGVIVSIIAGSLMLLVGWMLPDQGAAAMRASIGSLSDETGRVAASWLGVACLAGLGIGLFHARAMDAMALGDDEARSVGVPLGRVRLWLFLLAGALAAIAVVLAGPIGFVGLIAPHAARLLLGPAHMAVLIAAGLMGGTLMVGCDAASKAFPVASGTLPIGVIAALVGGPIFLVMLRRELAGRCDRL